MKVPEGIELPNTSSSQEQYYISLCERLGYLRNLWRNFPKIEYIKKEFEFNMKGFGKTRLYIGLYIEHLEKKILMHQMTYIDNVLKKFDMD